MERRPKFNQSVVCETPKERQIHGAGCRKTKGAPKSPIGQKTNWLWVDDNEGHLWMIAIFGESKHALRKINFGSKMVKFTVDSRSVEEGASRM